MATYRVTDERTGAEVRPGDTVTSFRGDPATFDRVTRGPLPGKSAKVFVRWANGRDTGEYYCTVFGLAVTPVEDDYPRP